MSGGIDDPIDAAFRTLIHTATDAGSAAPTIAEIEAGVITLGSVRPIAAERRPQRRWIAVAAAIVLIVGGLVWLTRHRHESTPVRPAPRVGLGDYLLPTALPAGWRLVAMSESAAHPAGNGPAVQVIASDTAPDERAVLVSYDGSLFGGTDITTPGIPRLADAVWNVPAGPFSGDASLQWSVDKHNASLTVRSLSESRTRDLAAALVPSTSASGFMLQPGSGFHIESSYPDQSGGVFGSADLVFADGHDNPIDIEITGRASLPSVESMLYPDEPADHVFVTPPSPPDTGVDATRSVGDLRVQAFGQTGADSLTPPASAEVSALLTALARDRGAVDRAESHPCRWPRCDADQVNDVITIRDTDGARPRRRTRQHLSAAEGIDLDRVRRHEVAADSGRLRHPRQRCVVPCRCNVRPEGHERVDQAVDCA